MEDPGGFEEEENMIKIYCMKFFKLKTMQCGAEDITQLVECFLKMYKVLDLIPSTIKHSDTAMTPPFQEVETGRSKVQGHFGIYQIQGQSKIHIDIKANLDCMRPDLKKFF